jgi:hypothetical protein
MPSKIFSRDFFVVLTTIIVILAIRNKNLLYNLCPNVVQVVPPFIFIFFVASDCAAASAVFSSNEFPNGTSDTICKS